MDLGPDFKLYVMMLKDPDGIQIELINEPLLQMDERPLGD